MNKGIIAINKPIGWTSFDVVNKVKHILHQKKVGHLGTLDPMATGVLLVTVGKATKLFDYMQQKQKTYVAKFEFGYMTDSLDLDGKIVEKTKILPSKNDILQVLPKFKGKINQIPPKYSAKSVNGKRAYELARQNVEFELASKLVEVFQLEMLDYKDNILTLKIVCGSGTYIRSLCRDIAKELNSLATMIELTRTNIDSFNLKNCIEIDKLTIENINSYIQPIKNLVKLNNINLDEIETKKILNGQTIITNYIDGLYLLNDNIDTIAMIKVEKNRAKMSIYLG